MLVGPFAEVWAPGPRKSRRTQGGWDEGSSLVPRPRGQDVFGTMPIRVADREAVFPGKGPSVTAGEVP